MLLSIVIPAYNAEKTLERTVETVLAQTFGDFELLIVNNGSKDATGDVAKRLAARDARVRVFDVYPNIWGYGARLYGWKRAKGEYITSVDADDFISPEMYETMLAVADKHDLDVVECDYDEVVGGQELGARGQGVSQSNDIGLYLSREEVVGRVVLPTFVDVGKSAYVWNKIYRNQYDFSTWKEGVFGSYEDLIHNLQLFRPVKSYGHIARSFYHYAPNEASVTRNFSASRVEQFETAANAKRELMQTYGISPDDRVFSRWVLNDAKNAILSASVFGQMDKRTRVELVKAIAGLPVVASALNNHGVRNMASAVVAMARSMSPSLAVALLRMVYR